MEKLAACSACTAGPATLLYICGSAEIRNLAGDSEGSSQGIVADLAVSHVCSQDKCRKVSGVLSEPGASTGAMYS